MIHIIIRLAVCTFLCISNTYAGIHTVTNTNDSGPGSLRQAIIDTNADPGPTRTINFSIGAGVQTIILLSDLPPIIVSNTTIDGSTQPGWSPNNPVIVINGSLLPAPTGFAGMLMLLNTSNCTIKDLVINGANQSNRGGILIGNDGTSEANNNAVYGCFIGTDQTGTVAVPNFVGIIVMGSTSKFTNDTIIGGALSEQRNVISGNSNAGLGIIVNSQRTVVKGNYIGTNKTATAAISNGFGVITFGSFTPSLSETCTGTIIGGTNAGERNIISGNSSGDPMMTFFGVVLGPNSRDTLIRNNYIGVDISGTAPLPNDVGIAGFGGDPASPDRNGAVLNSTIGGSSTDQGNVISSNTFFGIAFLSDTHDSIIQGNFIGTDKTATLNLGNGVNGIRIEAGKANEPNTNNLIGGTSQADKNIIVFNGPVSPLDGFGVLVSGDITTPDILNPILGNPIFNNLNNGIELRNNGNNNQAPPTINLACLAGNILTVTITAPASPAASNFRLEVFVNSVNRNPITEGERFAGAIISVPSGATVTESFLIANVTPGMWVSATATNLNNIGGTPGDTSPFTLNTIILAAPTVTVTAFPATILPTQSSTITATISGVPPFDLVWSDGFTQLGVTSPVTRVVSPLVTTTYSVTVTASTGCQTTGSVTVFVAGLSPISKAILNKYCGLRIP